MRQQMSQATAIVRRHRPDYRIVLCMGILVLIGLVVLFAISPARVEVINESGSSLRGSYFIERQAVYLMIGVAAFIAAATIPFRYWKQHASKVLLGGFAACALLAFLGLFMDGGIVLKSGGATSWFNFGFGSFQPAELLKFGLLLFVAGFLGRRMSQGKINSVSDTLIPLGVVVGLAALFIIVFQRDLGTGTTMLAIIGVMMFVAGFNKRMLLLSGGSIAAAAFMLIVTSPHRIDRVLTFMNPAGVADASSYHITQAKIAIGSGGFSGKGLGQSVQAFGYLPEAINDSIFAIFGESFGFIGLVLILAVFTGLLIRLLASMDHLIDPWMKLIVAGVFGWLGSHVIINVGSIIGIFPLTGVTLPFLSFGGSSLLFTMLALGLAFQLSRYTTHGAVKPSEDQHESVVRRRGVGGSRHPGRRRYQRA